MQKLFLENCRQNGVGWLNEVQFSRCYIFLSFGNNVDIVVHYDATLILDFCQHQ